MSFSRALTRVIITHAITTPVCIMHTRSLSLHTMIFWGNTTLSVWEQGYSKKIVKKNCFHDNFLISQPIPMMWSSLKSSLRDDSNEWSQHRVWLRNKRVSILKILNLRPHYCPGEANFMLIQTYWIEASKSVAWDPTAQKGLNLVFL